MDSVLAMCSVCICDHCFNIRDAGLNKFLVSSLRLRFLRNIFHRLFNIGFTYFSVSLGVLV